MFVLELIQFLLCEAEERTIGRDVVVVTPRYSEEVLMLKVENIIMGMRRKTFEFGGDATVEAKNSASKRLVGMGGERVEGEGTLRKSECERRIVI